MATSHTGEHWANHDKGYWLVVTDHFRLQSQLDYLDEIRVAIIFTTAKQLTYVVLRWAL